MNCLIETTLESHQHHIKRMQPHRKPARRSTPEKKLKNKFYRITVTGPETNLELQPCLTETLTLRTIPTRHIIYF